MTASIRRAQPEDAPAVLVLARAFATSFVVEPEPFTRAYHELLAAPGAYLAVAAEESRVVGYLLGFDHQTFFANGRVAWVEELTIAEAVRGQGVGRQLMAAFEAWAAARHSKLVALATRRAAPFYRAIGYEESAAYFRKLL